MNAEEILMLSVSSGHKTEISIIITININNINILSTNSKDFLIYPKEQKHCNCRRQLCPWIEIRFTTISFLVYVLTCLMYSSSRKYINPSWRSLIEMNKNNIFSRIVMRSASHRATINLSWEFQSLSRCVVVLTGEPLFQSPLWMLRYSRPRLVPTLQARSQPSTVSLTAPSHPPPSHGSTTRGPR